MRPMHMHSLRVRVAAFLLAAISSTLAVTVTDIQGPAFLSPLLGQTVNVTGIVTAKSTTGIGFWISGTPVKDKRVSSGLNVFTTTKTILDKINVGDEISLTGKVQEFKSSTAPDNLANTELGSPTNIVVLSTNNTITPVVLGKGGLSPPTEHISAFDVGVDGFLAVPNNITRVEAVNATLSPTQFGLDFWESLEGMLVTVPKAVATDFNNNFGEIFVHGDWKVTGKNARGGITLTFGPDGTPDGNPETIIVAVPMDGTKNPQVGVGDSLGDITGVILYQFGFYYIVPLTAPTVVAKADPTIPPSKIKPINNECTITIGDYNVENLTPTSSSMKSIASHIASFLNTPDIVFLQEIQDNSGSTDNGIVDANITLQNLVDNIEQVSGGFEYSFVEVIPVDLQDGGQPGGNIRQAYLFNPKKVALAGGIHPGGSLDSAEVFAEKDGRLGLTFNPGRVDPTNLVAWNSSRKPLAAVWESVLTKSTGDRFFTVNLHLTSKDGSSTVQGNARPPVNQGVIQRAAQVKTVATFVQTILTRDPNANVIVAGDCNDFVQTRSVFAPFDGILTDADEIAGIKETERYTYVFSQNNEQLDHIFLSNSIRGRGVQVEHVHVNNWAPTESKRISDHDPSVAKIKIC